MDLFDSELDIEYTESSDTDDQDDIESSYGGHAQSILSNMGDSIGRIDDYLTFERGFTHGDIVFSVEDPSEQMGRVMEVNMLVDLESNNGDIVKEVSTKKLCKFRSFGEGDYVVYGPWLGRVLEVYDLVTVLLDDGTKCEISTRDHDNLVPISGDLFEDGPCIYYPGRRVKINSSSSFKYPSWLCGSWSTVTSEGIVYKVEATSVVVSWIASVLVISESSQPAPCCLQNAENLTLLSCFAHANWQVGDWCKLSHRDFQIFASSEHNVFQSPIPKYPNAAKKSRIGDRCFEQIFVVTKTKTKVDVLWQNGDFSSGLDLQCLSPVNTIGDHDFWPGQFVLEKTILEDEHTANFQRCGIVKHVNAMERVVKVKWTSVEFDHNSSSVTEVVEETISAYELIEHPDNSYTLGDVVFRTIPRLEKPKKVSRSVENMLHEKDKSPSVILVEYCPIQLPHKDVEIGNECDDYASCYLSCIGSVIGFTDEGIEVRWANSVISKVEPSEIFGIEKAVISTTPTPHEEAIERTLKEIAEQEGQTVTRNKNELMINNLNNYEDCFMKKLFFSTSPWIPHAAEFLLNFALTYFDDRGSSSLSGENTDVPDRNHNSYVVEPHSLETTESFDHLTNEDSSLNKVDEPKIPLQVIRNSDEPLNSINQFKKFDIVDDYLDHHFCDFRGMGSVGSMVKRSWLKKVHQEWSILEKDLPDNIYVRAYEQRIDLLRAAIVGAAGTPYEDVLFFFDICFPSEYPHEPPMVHYISGGLRLNPNLYESGKVCLSLLNTWTGTGTEVWDRESSSVLQVLLSLQALVLNDKPYFNEAGYDKQMGRADGERNSITYNENAFLLSRKSMIYQLNKSPKHFEELVEEHFTSRSICILSACRALIDGTQIGCDFVNDEVTAYGHNATSTGFRIMLAKLLPKLVSAFTEKGIEVSNETTSTLLCI